MNIRQPALTYHFHGLNISSELELTELTPLGTDTVNSDSIDISVEIGRAPLEIEAPVVAVDDYQISGDRTLLSVPTVGRYFATGGSKIVIEPEQPADTRSLQLYLLGSGMAAALHQRGIFPLHACAIEHEDGCIAFVGDSGAGKSTLAAMLSGRGLKLLTDDVLVLHESIDSVLLAQPSVPLVKLLPEALDASALAGKQDDFDYPGSNKHRIIVRDRFAEHAVPIKRIYVLHWLLPSTAEPEISPVPGFLALQTLRKNVYRPELIDAMQRERAFLEFAGKLLARAPVFAFCRGMNLSQSPAQIDALVRHFQTG